MDSLLREEKVNRHSLNTFLKQREEAKSGKDVEMKGMGKEEQKKGLHFKIGEEEVANQAVDLEGEEFNDSEEEST
jgi:hypothetical protein